MWTPTILDQRIGLSVHYSLHSKFSQYKDIEGMDTFQVPLWKFLYQGLNNNWLGRIAYGRDVFLVPFDNIGTTVFVAELVQQLKSRNVDIDRLAGYRTRQQGTNLQQKEATHSHSTNGL